MSDTGSQSRKRLQLDIDLVGETSCLTEPPRKKMKLTEIKTISPSGKRKQFRNKAEKDQVEQEENLEHEEEEEDIDVAVPNNVNHIVQCRGGNNQSKLFGIGAILSNIICHLPMSEIVKLRGINRLFNDELAFGFECNNFDILFNYKNKYIIDIINHQYCGTLKQLTLFYLQSINLKKLGFAFKRIKLHEKEQDGNEQITVEETTAQLLPAANGRTVKIMRKEKSGLTTIEIIKIAVDRTYLMKESGNHSNNFGICFNEENGNCAINPFKSIYLETNLVNERLVTGEYCKNDTINTLLLSRFYKYKPLANKLSELMELDTEFRETMRISDDAIDGRLGYIWRSITGATNLFSWYKTSTDVVRGRPALLSDSSLFGNFDVYEKYIKSLNGDVLKIRESLSIMDGIFGLFGVFLRDDLAKDYVHYDGELAEAEQTLLYVIQPWMFNKYKELLIDDCMFVIDDDKTKWEFDLINNPRYHPLKRIEYLKLLTNSTQFCKSLLHYCPNTTDNYRYILTTAINRLYHSFDNFQQDWMLNKYSDLKGNINKQKEIHESFKYLIQFLFGICEYYIDDRDQRFVPHPAMAIVLSNQTTTIFESNVNGICNKEALDIELGNKNAYKFIDLNDDMIKNCGDLEHLYDAMKESHYFSDESFLKHLQDPLYNLNLFALKAYDLEDDNSSLELHFDPVSDIRTFLRKRWNFR